METQQRVVYTNGKDQDFIVLCQQLDEYLNELVGGEQQRTQYLQYNTLAEIHDVILIYVAGIPVAGGSFKFYEAQVAEVKRVFVRPEYRGQGIAQTLMLALEEQAREQGYKKLILETGVPLVAAIGLYQKLGYQIIENYGQYQGMKESICMAKELNGKC